MSFAGKIIKFEEIDKVFPDRIKFLDEDEVKRDRNVFSRHEPFYFMSVDCEERNYKYKCKEERLIISAITKSGIKIIVAVKYKPYLYLRVPDKLINLDPLEDFSETSETEIICSEFIESIKIKIKNEIDIDLIDNPKLERKFRGIEFQLTKGYYYRLEFDLLEERRKVLNYLVNNDYETAHDSKSACYRTIAREFKLSLTNWNFVKEYQIIDMNSTGIKKKYGICNAEYFIECSIDNVTACLDSEITSNEFQKYKSIVMGWDIECRSDSKNFPSYDNRDDTLFMIGVTAGFWFSPNRLISICICCFKTNPLPDMLTIRCNKESEVILAFAQVVKKIKPEFIIGFNDGDFDWRYYVARAIRYSILEKVKSYMSLLYKETYIRDRDVNLAIVNQFKKAGKIDEIKSEILTKDELENEAIRGIILIDGDLKTKLYRSFHKEGFIHISAKLDASTNIYYRVFKCFGYITIDMMLLLRLTNKSSNYKLNDFLKLYKLELKKDLSIVELFETVAEYVKAAKSKMLNQEYYDRMTEVARYCTYDADACLSLLLKANIIQDKKSVGDMAFVSMSDAIHNADGIKVQNLVASEASKRDYLLTSIFSNKACKFKGAFVMNPDRGILTTKLSIEERQKLHNDGEEFPNYTTKERLVEFASLTPELIEVFKKCIFAAFLPFLEIINSDIECKEELLLAMVEINDRDSQLALIEQAAEEFGLSNNHFKMIVNIWNEKCGRPVAALDFASLYPSIMMTYNLSIEKMLKSGPDLEDKAKKLIDKGFHLYKTTIKYKEKESGDKYSTEAYSIRHKFDPNKPGADMIKDGFGIFPSIQYNLKKERNEIKAALKVVEKQIDKANIEDRDDLEFRASYLNSRQGAVKIFMNTFYGETGNNLSPLYMLELSSSVTSVGRINLRLVIKFLNSFGFNVKYGDTDSAYFTCADKFYNPLDILFLSGFHDKITFCNNQVNLMINFAKRMGNVVNSMLLADNGTGFLKMEYEEVLFPLVFISSKMYFGLQHSTEPNFTPDNYKKPFMRGIKPRQKNVPNALRTIYMNVLSKYLNPEVSDSIIGVVKKAINQYFTSKWDITDFINSMCYKADKNNITAKQFVKRMADVGIEVKNAQRFDYVIVQKAAINFDINGRILPYKKGDFMEFPERAKELGLEIDLEQYFKSSMVGQFAQFIGYLHIFDEYAIHKDNKVNSKKIIGAAKRYLLNYYTTKFSSMLINHNFHKRVYKQTKQLIDDVVEKNNSYANIGFSIVKPLINTNYHNKEIQDLLMRVRERYEEESIIFVREMIKKHQDELIYLFKSDYISNMIYKLNSKINEYLYIKLNQEITLLNATTDQANVKLDTEEILRETIIQFRHTITVGESEESATERFNSKMLNMVKNEVNTVIETITPESKILSCIKIGELLEELKYIIILKMEYEFIDKEIKRKQKRYVEYEVESLDEYKKEIADDLQDTKFDDIKL